MKLRMRDRTIAQRTVPDGSQFAALPTNAVRALRDGSVECINARVF